MLKIYKLLIRRLCVLVYLEYLILSYINLNTLAFNAIEIYSLRLHFLSLK